MLQDLVQLVIPEYSPFSGSIGADLELNFSAVNNLMVDGDDRAKENEECFMFEVLPYMICPLHFSAPLHWFSMSLFP